MTTRQFATATLLTSFTLFSGGCAMFRYDGDDAPPPVPAARPTTVPSGEVADTSTVSGVTREVFVDFPTRVYELLSGKTPDVEAAAMEDARTADARRSGITSLVDRSFGKEAPYTTRYAQIAQYDSNPLVRATALRALNRSRDGAASAVYIAALADESALVRLEAAKALANVPSEGAAPSLLKVFNSAGEDLDIRIAAADALRHYRTIEVARSLINVLNEREFSLAWQARQSLRAMTGRDARFDQTAWLELITGPDNPLG